MGAHGVQALQERAHSGGHDYRRGSPHLKHAKLYDWCTSSVREELRHLVAAGVPATALEIGAGDGAFVQPLLAIGASVTATEMSRPSIEAVEERFGMSHAFDVVFDPDGSMVSLEGRRFGMVLYASVLHHIPDYLSSIAAACDRHLLPGGTLMTLQDPLWYPSVPGWVRVASDAMYLSWRVTQGNLMRGFASRVRRARNDLRPDRPGDVVEYHVLRSGLDQDSIERLLRPRFANVMVTSYWSAHARLWQSVGDRLGLRNTFALCARGHLADGRSAAS